MEEGARAPRARTMSDGQQLIYFDSTYTLRVVEEDKFKDTERLRDEAEKFSESALVPARVPAAALRCMRRRSRGGRRRSGPQDCRCCTYFDGGGLGEHAHPWLSEHATADSERAQAAALPRTDLDAASKRLCPRLAGFMCPVPSLTCTYVSVPMRAPAQRWESFSRR